MENAEDEEVTRGQGERNEERQLEEMHPKEPAVTAKREDENAEDIR